MLLPSVSIAQIDSGIVVRGIVVEAEREEPIIGARIQIEGTTLGDVSDANGQFEIQEVSPGLRSIVAKANGFQERRVELALRGDTTLRILLREKTYTGEEVVVQSDREREIEQRSVSRVTIDQDILDRVPAVAGEKDLFRVLQLLPGVKSLSEVSSGLYIRGGSPDQNLIRFDGAVIYNPSHLFGFFSTFITDAIDQVELIKGGYPAEFGGRLTSVLNITGNTGREDRWHGQTSISVISAKQTIEIPLYEGSAMISGRRTYIDAFLDAIDAESMLGDDVQLPRYYFYDLNAKVSQRLGNKNTLSLSTYYGRDILAYPQTGLLDINLNWGNTMASLNWTHIFNERLLSTTTAAYTEYHSTSFGSFSNNGYEFDNGIKEYTTQVNFDYRQSDAHSYKFGAGVSKFEFNFFNQIGTTNKPLKDTSGIPWYFSAYAQHEFDATDKLHVTYGLRSEWMHLSKVVTVDPRLTASYAFDPLWTAKFSAGVYHQYFHLASVGNMSFFDLWVPGTSPLPPSRSYQFILGVSGYPLDGYYASLETYYKPLASIIEYNETKFLTNDLNQVFPRGSGKTYGVELFLERREGALTGWIGYTLAWVKHRFDALNNGKEFSPKYDQRHDVQLVMNYRLSSRWEIGGTWVYATGQAYTAPLGYYHVGLSEINYSLDLLVPGHRGGKRLPAYHRGDLSATYSFKMFGLPAKASLQVYNFYNHKNVWFRAVDTDEQPPKQVDVTLLPILPTIGLEVTY